jgi:uncharacterized YigZ family protein
LAVVTNSYKTLSAPSEALYRVLGSKHLAYAYPCYSEEEAKVLIDALWKLHGQATHVCYAYRIGWQKDKFRANDDGEPSGTAGKPILGQIQSFDLTNVLVAVVRYFGGTKLGTGGLIDAYKTATQLALEAGSIVEKQVRDHVLISFTYEQMPKVMKALKDADMEKLHSHFDMQCEMEFLVNKSEFEKLVSELEELGVEVKHLGRK